MKPKKSLGQNFLRDKVVLDKIIASADLKPDDFVIEIGPGEGVLTKQLVKHAKKVVAIEIDRSLAKRLDSRFPASSAGSRGNDKVEIINADILEINLPEMIEQKFVDSRSCLPVGTAFEDSNRFNYKVIANIPYYITSPIIQLFLETTYPPTEMTLMVQKEVAERITAKTGQMSILAASVQYYARPELLFYVDKTSFFPVPEVDSAVIRIIHNQQSITPAERKAFFRVVRAGFSAKRKMLANNLSNSLHSDKKTVEDKLKSASISITARAQELNIDDWKKLAKLF